MNKFKHVSGGEAELSALQIQQLQEVRERDRELARRATIKHAEEHGWSQGDVDIVMQSLGLEVSPPPLIKRPIR